MHARPMGYYEGAIDPDGEHEYDICPRCGDIKQPDSQHCMRCATQIRQAKLEKQLEDIRIAKMLERHRLIKAGLMRNPLLESIAPIVSEWWDASQ